MIQILLGVLLIAGGVVLLRYVAKQPTESMQFLRSPAIEPYIAVGFLSIITFGLALVFSGATDLL